MLSWLPRRRSRIERIEAEAEALIGDLGVAAYSEARQREHEASSEAIARDWGLVALAVARKTGRRIGLDASTQMAMNVVFAPDRESAAAREPGPCSEVRPVELKQMIEAAPQPFRIVFISAAPDRGPSVLREVEIRASDPSAAIVAAANLTWPPRTIGLRILDSEGREVFWRQRAAR